MGAGKTNVVPLSSMHSLRRRYHVKWRHLVVLAFIVWGGYEYWFVQRPLLSQEGTSNQQLLTQIVQAKAQANALSVQVANLHSDKYIAQIAQQRYHLIMPGEVLFTAGNSGSSGSRP